MGLLTFKSVFRILDSPGDTIGAYQQKEWRMKAKRILYCLLAVSMAITLVHAGAIAQDKFTPNAAGSGQPASASFKSFKDYPDYAFNVKEYINGMQKGGHNLLIWKEATVNLSQYSSVRLTEFGGRLLPQQNVFSYDPFIALFNSVLRSSLKLRQEESPDFLLIEGAVVECNPGSRAARAWVGFGAGRAGGGVVCELYEPGRSNPCVRIYTRDTGASGNWGGDSAALLNNIMSQNAIRLATTLNNLIPTK